MPEITLLVCMLVLYNLRVSGHFGTENHVLKLGIIQKSLWILSILIL